MCIQKITKEIYIQGLRLINARKNRITYLNKTCGLLPNKKDYRDFVGTSSIDDSEEIYYKVPNIEKYSKSQGILQSCGSHALLTLAEMKHDIAKDRFSGIQFSELFHWWWVRQEEYMNNFPKNAGQTLREGCKVMFEIGITPETLMPYDVINFNDKPKFAAQGFADFFKIKGYYFLSSNEDIFTACPVVVGIKVYSDFMYLTKGQKLTKPSGAYHGGHAVVIAGFDKVLKEWLIVNSWGDTWGDNNTTWMPDEYLEKVLFDIAAIEL